MDFRILVVDDDVQIRRVLRATLIAARYEVDTAASGEESLEMMKDRKYHLVLLDLSMPGWTGWNCAASLRSTSEAEIIIISVRSIEHDIVAGLDAGADDYITKPFRIAGTAGKDSLGAPPECRLPRIGPSKSSPGRRRN